VFAGLLGLSNLKAKLSVNNQEHKPNKLLFIVSIGKLCDFLLIIGLFFGMVYVFGSDFLLNRLVGGYFFVCAYRRDFGDLTMIAFFLGLAVVLDLMGWLIGRRQPLQSLLKRQRKNQIAFIESSIICISMKDNGIVHERREATRRVYFTS
jgi:hypothetical protein